MIAFDVHGWRYWPNLSPLRGLSGLTTGGQVAHSRGGEKGSTLRDSGACERGRVAERADLRERGDGS